MNNIKDYITEKLFISKNYSADLRDWSGFKKFLKSNNIYVANTGAKSEWWYIEEQGKKEPFIHLGIENDFFYLSDKINAQNGTFQVYFNKSGGKSKKMTFSLEKFDFDIVFDDQHRKALKYTMKNALTLIDIITKTKYVEESLDEKLYIGKGYDSDVILRKDNIIGRVCAFDNTKEALILTYEPAVFKFRKDSDICYNHLNNKNVTTLDVIRDIKKNSNGFYEAVDKVDNRLIYLVMSKDDILKFIDRCSKENIKKVLPDYFDIHDKFLEYDDIHINRNQKPFDELEKMYNETDK